MTTEKMNTPLITRIDLPATFQSIPVGKKAVYDCMTIGNYGTVYSAVRRLNEKIGKKEYLFETPDNGATYFITHLKNPEKL